MPPGIWMRHFDAPEDLTVLFLYRHRTWRPRAAILEILLEAIDNKEEINYQTLARKTKDFSGADLRLLIDNARQTRIREAMKTGQSRPLNQNDLLSAAKDVRPSTKEWLKKAKNYALFANEGGLYNEILEYLKMNPI